MYTRKFFKKKVKNVDFMDEKRGKVVKIVRKFTKNDRKGDSVKIHNLEKVESTYQKLSTFYPHLQKYKNGFFKRKTGYAQSYPHYPHFWGVDFLWIFFTKLERMFLKKMA